MSGHVTITLSAPPYRTTVKGMDERLCCIQAENIYRAWLKQGFAVQTRIVCADPLSRMRIRDYLLDVLREATHDLLLGSGAETGWASPEARSGARQTPSMTWRTR